MQLRGSERAPLPAARPVGVPDPGEPVEITLLLRRRVDGPPFPRWDVAADRRPETLSREEFARRHGAHPDDLDRVGTFLEAEGLALLPGSVGGRTLRARGGAGRLSELFGCRLERWAYPGGSYRGRTGALSVPAPLEPLVLGVFGLDDRPQAFPHFRRRRSVAPGDQSYPPTEVAAAYGFPGGLDGSGQTIAFLELGGGYAPADLTAFFSGAGIPTPSVTAVGVDGAQNAPTGQPDGPDGEVELDLEVAGSVAPGARLAAYFAPNTDRGFLDGVTEAIHDASRRPSILSISWGGPEPSWTPQALSALDSAFQDAAALGVTVLAAAGDHGATDGTPGGVLAVDFPASSPFVTGCGGTHLTLGGVTIEEETVWNDLAVGEGATGGGVSQVFGPPAYQSGARVPLSPAGTPGRGVPDVAGDADPATGYSVYIDGAPTVIGGTSAVAPLWAGLVARLNPTRPSPLGFLNPAIYALAEAGGFRDITEGNNGGYSAGPGWDPCTGLGSPNGAKLARLLGRNPVP